MYWSRVSKAFEFKDATKIRKCNNIKFEFISDSEWKDSSEMQNRNVMGTLNGTFWSKTIQKR